LLECAGGDCTARFREIHAYINGHAMLGKCYVGNLARAAPLGALSEEAAGD
jgi:nitrate reductase (NAD(P)H)